MLYYRAPVVLVLVLGQVDDVDRVDGFEPLDAGAAATAVDVATLVAAPGLVKRDVEFGSTLSDVGLRHLDEGRLDVPVHVSEAEVACLDGLLKPSPELRPAVRVDGSVTVVHGSGDVVASLGDADRGCDRGHHHVAVRYDRHLHVLAVVLALGHLDSGVDKG